MRILIVTEIFAPGLGGVPMFIERLADQLSLAGDEVMVLTDTASLHVRTQKSILPSGVKLVRVPAVASVFNRGNNRMSYNPWRAVTRALDDMHPDCIHMHTPAGLLHKIVLKQARRRNIPVVITNHVMPENLTMNLPAFLGTYMSRKVHQITTAFINRTDYLIAPTQTALDLLGDDITIPKQAITNGIDAKLYCPGSVDVTTLKKFSINEHYRTILYTGRLDGEKRVDILIRAFSEVRRELEDVQLVIVGTGLLDRDLQALATKLGVANSVIFTGRISDGEKLCLLRFATVFVMPSPAELQCISALEALSTGLPIVVADQAALLELVHEGKNGYAFSYPDAADCARAILQVLTAPFPKKLLEENTRQWIINNHDQAITIRQHQAVYRALVSGSTVVPPMS